MTNRSSVHVGTIVVTTIQGPTQSMERLSAVARANTMRMIVVGDRKTPTTSWPAPIDFFNIERQAATTLKLAELLPFNHYARKNLGYLLSIQGGAGCVFDTDDDNAPLSDWATRDCTTSALRCVDLGWVNAYRWFTDSQIWPRGLPLEFAHLSHLPAKLGEQETVSAPIQQGLANGSPDVDAVWRLLLDKPLEFSKGSSVLLPAGAWCPFNSQSTWWFPQAYPLMYLPSFVSFRMTDIWRSFVAQRCLWELGLGVVFHGPEMFQDRNEHSLMRDFEQEIPGYLNNERIREKLEATALLSGEANIGGNLHRCYEALVDMGIVPAKEMPLVEAWLADVDAVRPVNRPSSE